MPGYIIDEAQRIIQLEANQHRGSCLPTHPALLHLIKLSSDGSGWPGDLRIAKIEDGSHYLDRTTDSNGEI